MILFNDRPSFEEAWAATPYRVLMAGMGDDTAMLIAEMYERGYEPDEIIFCDTGSEFPHTYKFIEDLKTWCIERAWSKVVILQKYDSDGKPLSVIGNAEAGLTLPSAAFGSKSCSLRFKAETADKYLNNSADCHKAWGIEKKGVSLDRHTGAILRIIGINADEPQRAAKWKPEHKWVQAFPLVDWEIGEHESGAVSRVGLYYPGKSSCICCPHLTGRELDMMRREYPKEFGRVIAMERNYIDFTRRDGVQVKGLCRRKTIADQLEDFERGKEIPSAGCEICSVQ